MRGGASHKRELLCAVAALLITAACEDAARSDVPAARVPTYSGALDAEAPPRSIEAGTLDASASEREATQPSRAASDARAADAPREPDSDTDGASDELELACGSDAFDARDRPDPTRALGTGTRLDPLTVCLPEQLRALLVRPDAPATYVKLTRDLDFGGQPLRAQLGTELSPYTATLDGAGHALRHLQLGDADTPLAGLIAVLAPAGVVRDLRFEDAVGSAGALVVGVNEGTLTGVRVGGDSSGQDHIGLLVNRNHASGSIADCASSGTLRAVKSHVGGLVGENAGTIRRAVSSATVAGENRVGGLVGSGGGTIEQAYATGDVHGERLYVGGLLGTAGPTARVHDVYATARVESLGGPAGGLVGSMQGAAELARCYARNVVQGSPPRGLVGTLEAGASATLSDCYFDASLTPEDPLGTPLSAQGAADPSSYRGFDFSTPIWNAEDAQQPPQLALAHAIAAVQP